MYVFRPIPITSCSENWVIFSPVLNYIYTAPDYAPTVKSPCNIGESTTRNGYDFTSLVDNNSSEPYRNFVGRMPKGNDTSSDNQNSWIRKGVSNLFKCFIPSAAGYTESYGDFGATLLPAENSFSPELMMLPQERLFLLCNGVVGSRFEACSVSYRGGDIPNSLKYVNITENSPEIDYILNPELPSNAKSFLYSATAGLDAESDYTIADGLRFKISARSDNAFFSSSVSFIENACTGRLSHIGSSQWSGHRFSTVDRSNIITDAWGMASLSKRRVSKTVQIEVLITPEEGSNITRKITEVLRLFMYLRGSVHIFIMSNTDFLADPLNTLREVNYADVMPGILKTFKIEGISGKQAKASVTIETIPSAYDPDYSTI